MRLILDMLRKHSDVRFKSALYTVGTQDSYGSIGSTDWGNYIPNTQTKIYANFTMPTDTVTGVNNGGVPFNPSFIKVICRRQDQLFIIDQDGYLWTAGWNGYGQLGLGAGSPQYVYTLTKVMPEKNDWVDIGSGTYFSAALDANGDIWGTGNNSVAASVGDGSYTDRPDFFNTRLMYTTAKVMPKANSSGGFNSSNPTARVREDDVRFVSMAVGHRFVMGLTADGDIYNWGNDGGARQLGRSAVVYPDVVNDAGNATQEIFHRKLDLFYIPDQSYNGPRLAMPPGGVLDGNGNVVCSFKFKKIYAGGYHAGAFDLQGNFWTWGQNDSNQRGLNPPQWPNHPRILYVPGSTTEKWADAYMGEYSTFLRKTNGDIYALGKNLNGQLGIGSTTNASVPTQVIHPLAGSYWVSITNDTSTTLAIDSNGWLWGWGSSSNSKLGSKVYVVGGNWPSQTPDYNTQYDYTGTADWLYPMLLSKERHISVAPGNQSSAILRQTTIEG